MKTSKRQNTKTVAATKGKAVSAKPANNGVQTVIRPLSASSLKDILWETLTDLKHDQIMPNRADAIAAQSREILRTIKVQLQVAGQAKRSVPQEIIEFTERR
jgi:hypothetical protein